MAVDGFQATTQREKAKEREADSLLDKGRKADVND